MGSLTAMEPPIIAAALSGIRGQAARGNGRKYRSSGRLGGVLLDCLLSAGDCFVSYRCNLIRAGHRALKRFVLLLLSLALQIVLCGTPREYGEHNCGCTCSASVAPEEMSPFSKSFIDC